MTNLARSLALFVALPVFGLALISCQAEDFGATETSPGGPPNIVFILADDLDAASAEYMPNLSSLLAEEGVTFENAFVTHSLCCPSRSSTLRGQYTHNHQVFGNGEIGGFKKFHEMGHEESNAATWLQSGGYRTVLVGKYLNGYPKQPKQEQYPEGIDPAHVPPGWDKWYGRIEGGSPSVYQLNENGELVSYERGEEGNHVDDVLARKATDYVRRTADDPRPFFMYLAPKAPHEPFEFAARHQGEFAEAKAPRSPSFNEEDVGDKPSWVRDLPSLSPAEVARIDEVYRARLRMMLAVDEMISGVIGELEEAGKLENTYIVFTSDNGYHLGEHRRLGKETAYEEDIRVPLIVHGPDVPAGKVVDQLALNIDLAPTFAEFGGVPAPAFVNGRSLAPLLTGGDTVWRRSGFLLEHWNEDAQAYMARTTKACARRITRT